MVFVRVFLTANLPNSTTFVAIFLKAVAFPEPSWGGFIIIKWLEWTKRGLPVITVSLFQHEDVSPELKALSWLMTLQRQWNANIIYINILPDGTKIEITLPS